MPDWFLLFFFLTVPDSGLQSRSPCSHQLQLVVGVNLAGICMFTCGHDNWWPALGVFLPRVLWMLGHIPPPSVTLFRIKIDIKWMDGCLMVIGLSSISNSTTSCKPPQMLQLSLYVFFTTNKLHSFSPSHVTPTITLYILTYVDGYLFLCPSCAHTCI